METREEQMKIFRTTDYFHMTEEEAGTPAGNLEVKAMKNLTKKTIFLLIAVIEVLLLIMVWVAQKRSESLDKEDVVTVSSEQVIAYEQEVIAKNKEKYKECDTEIPVDTKDENIQLDDSFDMILNSMSSTQEASEAYKLRSTIKQLAVSQNVNISDVTYVDIVYDEVHMCYAYVVKLNNVDYNVYLTDDDTSYWEKQDE